MSTTKTTGTCGACFRTMSLDKTGRVVRHGWVEEGGRRAGEYGNAWHSGSCFGCGHLPYEVSPDCTTAYLAEVLFPTALRLNMRLESLATNPDLLFEGRNHPREWNAPESEGRFDVLIRHGDAETRNRYFSTSAGEAVDDYYSKVPSYAAYHEKVFACVERDYLAVSCEAHLCISKAEAWAPVAVAIVEKKVPLVHTVSENANLRLRRSGCGRAAFSMYGARILHTTRNAAEVTCPKCIAKMQKTTSDSA